MFQKLLTICTVLMLFCFSQIGYAQLSGNYSIPGTPFVTIKAAVDSLNLVGVGTGGVTFNVTAGHTETTSTDLILTATGATTDQIIFQKSGAGANPIITRTDIGIYATGIIGGQGDAVIIIQGSDYVTFDGIDVATSDAGIEYGYYLRKVSGTNGCKYITIKNALIDLTKGLSNAVAGIYSSNNDAASLPSVATGITVTSVGGRNEFITITGNTIQDVFGGIYVIGYNHTVLPHDLYDQNFVIGTSGAGNTIQNFGGNALSSSSGINLTFTRYADVNHNTVNNLAGGGTAFTAGGYGIYHGPSQNGYGHYNHNKVSVSATGGGISAIQVGSSLLPTPDTLSADYNEIYISQSGTGSISGIYFGILGNNSWQTQNYNKFTYGAFASTNSSSYMINRNSAATYVEVIGNELVGPMTKTATSGTYYFIYNGTSGTMSGVEIIRDNIVDSITVAGGTVAGMYLSQGNLLDRNIYNNTVAYITNTNASGTVIGTLIGGGTTVQFHDNNIHHLSGAGSNTYGLQITGGVNMKIYRNNVYNLITTGAGLNGIYTSALTGPAEVYNNKVYNLTGTNVSQTIRGIYIGPGPNSYAYNNFVSDLKAPNSNPASATTNLVNGIYSASTTVGNNIGLYYNTVYLNAASTGANFSTAGIRAETGSNLDMRNNIVVNLSTPGSAATAKTVAFLRSSATLTTYSNLSNNNLFYSGTPSSKNVIYFDGTSFDSTMNTFKNRLSPRESSSFAENPNFLDVVTTPYNLHIKDTVATQIEGGGTPVSTPLAITTDYDNDTRNASIPDVGADEFNGIGIDLVAPNIVYTPLIKTASTATRTLVATITDPSGVPTTDPGMPRLYWKKNFNGIYVAETPTYLGSYQFQYSIGSGVAANDTVFYYIVARDLNNPTANVGSSPAGASGFTYDPPSATNPPSAPSWYAIVVPFTGNYNIGTGEVYTSLTDSSAGIFRAINNSLLTGDVTITIKSNTTETGYFALNQPLEEGTGTYNIAIVPDGTTERVLSGNVSTHDMIVLNGVDRVTIDGRFNGSGKYLRFSHPEPNRATIVLKNGSSNNKLQFLNVKGGYGSNGLINFVAGALNTDNLIYSCDIDSAGTIASAGINVATGSTANLVIRNCNISGFNLTGINILQVVGVTIDSCNVFMHSPSALNSATGISVSSSGADVFITRNKVYDIFASALATSIKGINLGGSSTSYTFFVNNNMVTLNGNTNADVSGIYWAGNALNSAEIYNNSVFIGDTAISGTRKATGIYKSSSATNFFVKNNIFHNAKVTTGSATGINTAIDIANTVATSWSLDNNDYSVVGVGPLYAIGHWGSGTTAAYYKTTLQAWRDTAFASTGFPQDINTISANPNFISTNNLHVQPLSGVVNNIGAFIASVPQDIDGDIRNNPPDLGADEYVYIEPAIDNPTNVTANTISGTQINVAFTPNANNHNVLIIWNTTGAFTTPSGTPPLVDSAFAGGTILYNGISSPVNHTGLTQGTNYYYKLFSYNGSIYSSGVAVDTTTFTTSFQLSVTVYDNWNMSSVPGVHPTNQNVTTWWPGKDTTANVFKYSGGYQVVNTTTPGEGYWMKHLNDTTYNTGDEWPAGGILLTQHNPIAATAGWNLIGGYENSALVSGITTTPEGLQDGAIYGYSGGYLPATNLVPGYGYWIKLSGAGQINLPNTLLKSANDSKKEFIKADWGKIIITDNANRTYTLYAVKGEVNLNSYELPPAPPAGMLDIRFGSGRIAEDVSNGNQSILLSGIQYPVRVKVEDLQINLEDESGKIVKASLTDGQEITIQNSTVNKLRIVSGEVGLPEVYSLDQNYPNPFNPSTTIRFALPEAGNVNLTIYNVIGEKITELVNNKLEAGRYSFTWDAGNIATGLYIYELRTEKFVSVKKMMLIK